MDSLLWIFAIFGNWVNLLHPKNIRRWILNCILIKLDGMEYGSSVNEVNWFALRSIN